MFLKNLNKRERLIAGMTAVMAVTALLYSCVLEPALIRWLSLKNEISSRQNVLSKDQRLSLMHEKIASEYANFSKYVELHDLNDCQEKWSGIPPARRAGCGMNSAQGLDTGMADTMSLIETTSRKDNCTIVNMKPLGGKREVSYKENLIEVTAEAPMDALSRFMYDIESSNNAMVRIKRFSLTPKPGQAGVLRGILIISKILII